MAKAKKPLVVVDPELDPIFPLPFGTGIIPIKQGEGKSILENTHIKMVELPYRAFYILWEHAERIAARDYPKYVGGPLDNAAQAALEMVHAFRSASRGDILPILSEEAAQKIREKEAKRARKRKSVIATAKSVPVSAKCPECGSERLKKIQKDGRKLFRCLDCRFRKPRRFFRLPAEAPETLSNARNGSKSGSNGHKPQNKAQKPRKRPQKVR